MKILKQENTVDAEAQMQVFLSLSSSPSVGIFRDVLIRRNRVRPVDNVFDERSMGFGANWVEHLIAEKNIFSALGPDPMGYIHMGTVKHFNNQTAAGRLLQGELHPYPPVVSLGYFNQLEPNSTLF